MAFAASLYYPKLEAGIHLLSQEVCTCSCLVYRLVAHPAKVHAHTCCTDIPAAMQAVLASIVTLSDPQ